MEWNGSFLGYITKSQILNTLKFAGEVYWRLQVKDALTSTDTTLVCRARGAQNTYACIIDQLKELFNLPKIGTHWVKLGKKIIILSKVVSNSEFDVVVYNKLAQFPKTIYPEFANSVRKIFAFKEVFGIKYATLNAIKLVESDRKSDSEFDAWSALSVKDTHFDFTKGIIKTPMLKLWFDNKSENVSSEIYDLLDITKENYNKKIHMLRTKIDDIIKLVDKDQVMLATFLLERVDSFY